MSDLETRNLERAAMDSLAHEDLLALARARERTDGAAARLNAALRAMLDRALRKPPWHPHESDGHPDSATDRLPQSPGWATASRLAGAPVGRYLPIDVGHDGLVTLDEVVELALRTAREIRVREEIDHGQVASHRILKWKGPDDVELEWRNAVFCWCVAHRRTPGTMIGISELFGSHDGHEEKVTPWHLVDGRSVAGPEALATFIGSACPLDEFECRLSGAKVERRTASDGRSRWLLTFSGRAEAWAVSQENARVSMQSGRTTMNVAVVASLSESDARRQDPGEEPWAADSHRGATPHAKRALWRIIMPDRILAPAEVIERLRTLRAAGDVR